MNLLPLPAPASSALWIGRLRHTGWIGLWMLLLLPGLTGCDRKEPIRQYIAPTDPPHAPAMAGDPHAHMAPATQPRPSASSPATAGMSMSPDAIPLPPAAAWSTESWTAPADWIATDKPALPRLGHFRIGPESAPADLVITRFPGDVGGMLANVNRWRGQMGLAPITDLKDQSITNLPSTANLTVNLVDIPAPARDAQSAMRTYVGVIAAPDNHTWFLKLTGPDATLLAQRQAFIQFLQAFRPNSSSAPSKP